MKEKVIYCNNAILNKPGFNSTAAVSIKLELGQAISYEDDKKERYPSLSGSLCISDCNRVIELDCYASDKEAYDNVVHKLRTLNDIVNAALIEVTLKQSQFNDQYDRVEARTKQEELDKKRKTKASK